MSGQSRPKLQEVKEREERRNSQPSLDERSSHSKYFHKEEFTRQLAVCRSTCGDDNTVHTVAYFENGGSDIARRPASPSQVDSVRQRRTHGQ
jgi:hypothetical protein